MVTINGYICVLDRNIITDVSLAVVVNDDYTCREAQGDVFVTLKKGNKKTFKTPNGFHVFTNQPEGLYTLDVRSDHYFSLGNVHVNLPIPDPQNPLVIILKPQPSYPFPASATLIRGSVLDTAEKPVSGATVEIIGKDITNHTNARGEFVLYFNGLTDGDVVVEDSKRYVRGPMGKIITVRATHDNRVAVIELMQGVEEGTTTVCPPLIII